MDFYKVLRVSRGATTKEIKIAFRKLALELHPDRTGGCNEKAKKFATVVDAYNTLSNAELRKKYDRICGNPSSSTYSSSNSSSYSSSTTSAYRPRTSFYDYKPLDASIPYNEKEWNAWHYPELGPDVVSVPNVTQRKQTGYPGTGSFNSHAEYFRKQSQYQKTQQYSSSRQSTVNPEFRYQVSTKDEYFNRKDRETAPKNDSNVGSRDNDQCCIQ